MSDERPPAVPEPENDGPPPVPGIEIFDEPAPAAPVTTADAAGAETSQEPELAHPVLRALAFAMDGAGTFTVTVIVVFAGLGAGYGLAFAAILYVPLLSAVLSTVLTALYGVTPSKAILGIRVVDAVTGAPLGWRSILRSLVIVAPIGLTFLAAYASYFLPASYDNSFFGIVLVPPFLGWVALLVVLSVRPRYRGLQDLAGRSIVVHRRPAPRVR